MRLHMRVEHSPDYLDDMAPHNSHTVGNTSNFAYGSYEALPSSRSMADWAQSSSMRQRLSLNPFKSLATLLLAFNPIPGWSALRQGCSILAGHPRLHSDILMVETAGIGIKLPSDWMLGGGKSSQLTALVVQLAGLRTNDAFDDESPLDVDSKREASIVRGVLRKALGALYRYRQLTAGPVQVDAQLSASFLNDMGIGDFSPLLEQLPQDAVAGASGPAAASTDLRRFLISAAHPIAANPLLVSVLEEYPVEKLFGGADDDEELHRLVHYFYVLNLVVDACARNPGLAAAVFNVARKELRETMQGLTPTLFEQAKIFTVERSLELFHEHRLQLDTDPIPARFGQVGLPFNILEAVLQDAFIGRISNALAGVPLMLAQPGHSPASVSSDDQKRVKVHMPLPQEWQHLYISWNLAFTSLWADWPYFAAALLIPSVSGSPPDEFIFHRAYALYFQIVAHMRRRSADDEPVVSHVQAIKDWRDEDIAEVWGNVNVRAAKSFFARCQVAQKFTWDEDFVNFEKVLRTLKVDIPEILRKEPNWEIFADDFTLMDKTGAKLEGLAPNKLLLQLLIAMSKKLDMKDDIRFYPIADSGGFGEIPKFLVVRWQVQISDEKHPIDIEAETVFYLNDNNEVDYMRIDKWLVNRQPCDVWPEVDLSEDPARNLERIEEWVHGLRRGTACKLQS